MIRQLGQHGVKVHGTKRSELVAERVRSDAMEKEEEQDEEDGGGDGVEENGDIEPPNRLPNFVKAHKPLPYSPVYARKDPVIRSWAAWDWKQEVRPPTSAHTSDAVLTNLLCDSCGSTRNTMTLTERSEETITI